MTRTAALMNRLPIRCLISWPPILACSWLLACGPALPDPVRVYVGGQLVQAEAQATDQIVTGQLLPVLAAIGAEATLLPPDNALAATAPDGTHVRAVFGSTRLDVNGRPVSCDAAFEEENGDVRGPLRHVAEALGCVVRYDEEARELRIAHRLAQVEAHAAEEAAFVHLRFSGSAAAELRHLADPPRAYADFAGLVWQGGSETLEVGSAGGLRRVRWALFQEWPPITRVVADLEPGAQAQLSQVADRVFVITVRPGPDSAPGVPPGQLANAHIVLDPAGGDTDSGGTGVNTRAKATNLDIAVRLAVRLMNAGAIATLTRQNNVTVSVDDRARLANEANADLVLTIACGVAESRDECGAEVWYAKPPAHDLAAALQAALVSITGASDPGVSLSPEGCLSGTKAPSVTAIVGFLTCPGDQHRLASPDYRDKVASALAQGIAAHLRHNVGTHHAAAKEAGDQ